MKTRIAILLSLFSLSVQAAIKVMPDNKETVYTETNTFLSPISASVLRFDTNHTLNGEIVGDIAWDSDHKVPTFTADGGPSFGWGDESPRYVRNMSGITLTNGMVVYATETTGHTPDVYVAIATSAVTAEVYGMVTVPTIADSAFGWVVRNGRIHGLDTSAVSGPFRIYLATNITDSVTGLNWSTNKSNNGYSVRLGAVRNSHATQGVVEFWPSPLLAFNDIRQDTDLITEANVLYTNTFWDDLTFPFDISATVAGGLDITENIPENSITFTTGCGTNVFATPTADDHAFGVAQMSHKKKLGSVIGPHLHYIQTNIDQSTNMWVMFYRFYNTTETVPAWSSVRATNATAYTSGSVLSIAAFPSISAPSGETVSALFDWKIARDGSIGTGNVSAKTFDIHYEIDQPGSQEAYTK